MKASFDFCIIGGMGPYATAELVRRVALYTDAKKDSEHPSLCVFSSPDIPDRSEFVASDCKRHPLNIPIATAAKHKAASSTTPPVSKTKNKSSRINAPLLTAKEILNPILPYLSSKIKKQPSNEPASPLKAIKRQISAAKRLHCRYFAIGCNTAHYFYKEYEKIRGIKFINTVRETAEYAYYTYPERNVCILGTTGTVYSDIYGLLSPKKTKIKYPSPPVCEEIMCLIRRIKGGFTELDTKLHALRSHLKAEFDTKKTVFILGCTELSLVKDRFNNLAVVDSTDVLAGCVISACKKRFNKETFSLKSEFFDGG